MHIQSDGLAKIWHLTYEWHCQRTGCTRVLQLADLTLRWGTLVWMTLQAAPSQAYITSLWQRQLCSSRVKIHTQSTPVFLQAAHIILIQSQWTLFSVFVSFHLSFPASSSKHGLAHVASGAVIHNYPSLVLGNPCAAGTADCPGCTTGFHHDFLKKPLAAPLSRARAVAAVTQTPTVSSWKKKVLNNVLNKVWSQNKDHVQEGQVVLSPLQHTQSFKVFANQIALCAFIHFISFIHIAVLLKYKRAIQYFWIPY